MKAYSNKLHIYIHDNLQLFQANILWHSPRLNFTQRMRDVIPLALRNIDIWSENSLQVFLLLLWFKS